MLAPSEHRADEILAMRKLANTTAATGARMKAKVTLATTLCTSSRSQRLPG